MTAMPASTNPGRAYPVLASLQIATGAGIILFWLLFFTVGLAPENPPPGYYAFEHAFPLPDFLLALALLRAASLLLSGDPGDQRKGRTFSLACAGALLFLGALDFNFNVQNGLYTKTSLTDAVTAVLIQAWCIGFGLGMAWRFRIR
jgi:hypothetical protein